MKIPYIPPGAMIDVKSDSWPRLKVVLPPPVFMMEDRLRFQFGFGAVHRMAPVVTMFAMPPALPQPSAEYERWVKAIAFLLVQPERERKEEAWRRLQYWGGVLGRMLKRDNWRENVKDHIRLLQRVELATKRTNECIADYLAARDAHTEAQTLAVDIVTETIREWTL